MDLPLIRVAAKRGAYWFRLLISPALDDLDKDGTDAMVQVQRHIRFIPLGPRCVENRRLFVYKHCQLGKIPVQVGPAPSKTPLRWTLAMDLQCGVLPPSLAEVFEWKENREPETYRLLAAGVNCEKLGASELHVC